MAQTRSFATIGTSLRNALLSSTGPYQWNAPPSPSDPPYEMPSLLHWTLPKECPFLLHWTLPLWNALPPPLDNPKLWNAFPPPPDPPYGMPLPPPLDNPEGMPSLLRWTIPKECPSLLLRTLPMDGMPYPPLHLTSQHSFWLCSYSLLPPQNLYSLGSRTGSATGWPLL